MGQSKTAGRSLLDKYPLLESKEDKSMCVMEALIVIFFKITSVTMKAIGVPLTFKIFVLFSKGATTICNYL